MNVFLAGAAGAIGRRLVPLLLRDSHEVTGTTRSAEKGRELARSGVLPAVLDVFDPHAVTAAMRAAKPEVVIHQLTDLPREFDEARIAASYANNARIRTEGTRNLIAAAQAAAARRLIVQSIAFGYAPGGEPHPETDPLNLADPARAVTIKATADMERQVLAAGLDAVILRYGLFYGPGTWHDEPVRRPALHVDAAAHATLLALTRGRAGIYNIADDDSVVSIAKARAELGFDPQFRLQ
ncbi:MAG TPA: NAD(P)-dependent oxidoreductase [Xanthobacteraceae bacterium]|nr:NAD(P)-dependent oxidoreductase [Xanthobacteraceae bacterium]